MVNNIYCPICEKELKPENEAEVLSGEHDGFIYVHENIPHEDSDIDALKNGIN